MTEKQLTKLNFKKKKMDDSFWFELCYKNHFFLTNDTINNKGKDYFFIGYENKKNAEDTYWFNENLSKKSDFKKIFKILVNKDKK